MADGEWRSRILQKIEVLIKDKTELAEIVFYLAQQDDASHGYKNSAIWKMLKDFVNSDEAFLALLKRILQEAQRNRQPVRDCMVEVYNQLCIKDTSNNVPAGKLDIKELTTCGSIGFAHAWSCISPEAQARILEALPHLVGTVSSNAATSASAVVNVFGKRASIALAAVYLSYEAFHNIYRWWNGEISGKRVWKNIIDSTTSVSAGIAGGLGGAAAGAPFGPLGIVVGAVVGSILSSAGSSIIINKLTEEIFDIPKDEALEKAYSFLGVGRKSSNEVINKAFRSLCLRHHPDKGGQQEMFLKLQSYMAIIKISRGERN